MQVQINTKHIHNTKYASCTGILVHKHTHIQTHTRKKMSTQD